MGPYGPEFDRVQEDDARFVARAKRAFVGLLGLSRDTYGLQSTTARSEMRRGIDEALGLVADPRSSIQVEMQKRPDFIVAGLGTLTVNNEEERPGPGSRGILLTPSSDIGDKSSGFAEGTDEDGGYLAALEEGLEGNELDNPYFAKRKRDRRGSLSNTGLGVLDGGEKEEREPAPKDLAAAVIAAFQSPYFNEPLTARVDYRRSRKAREHRLRKYKSVVGSDDPFILSQQDGNSQIIAENIVANNKKLAMRGEQHRGLAVLLAMRYRDPNKRAKLMEKFDEAARNNTREIVRRVKAGEELDYDIVIRGGGE